MSPLLAVKEVDRRQGGEEVYKTKKSHSQSKVVLSPLRHAQNPKSEHGVDALPASISTLVVLHYLFHPLRLFYVYFAGIILLH
jgi:hypothetical protein